MSRERKSDPPKIERIELSEKNIKLRWILVCVLAAIAVIAILWGIIGNRQKAGWYTVSSTSTGLHCGHDVVFTYEYGAAGKKAHKEAKELVPLYTALTENAWKLFYNEAEENQLGSLYRVNSNPNKEVSVDPALYQVFQLLESCNSRLHYLGPVYAAYDQVFYAVDELIAAECDPGQDEESRQYVLQLAQFAADPNAVRLELRQDYKVQLHVSQDYEAFLQDNMVQNCYLDFGWLRSAVVVDYLAQQLEANGFTNGNLTTIDGFARNLDRRDVGYQLSLFNLRNGKPELAATMENGTPSSVVYLRTYDSSKVFTFPNGRVVTYMVDIADGQCKAAMPNVVSYSEKAGCTEIALQIASGYIAESFNSEVFNNLAAEGICSVWFEKQKLCYNQKDLSIILKNEDYVLFPVN